MAANTAVSPVWEERTFGVVTLIVVATTLIFYLDLITPLGLTVWILYFIPLYLTFYLRWDAASFVATAAFIILIGATTVLSYRDVPLLYAALNRLFFAGMLIVSALFIWNARRAVDRFRVSEEHHRRLFESSMDSVLVSSGDRILYANPAGERMFGADAAHALVGQEFESLVDPAARDTLGARLQQASEGARMLVRNVRMTTFDGRPLCADAALSEIVWDGAPAVEIVLRPAAQRGSGT